MKIIGAARGTAKVLENLKAKVLGKVSKVVKAKVLEKVAKVVKAKVLEKVTKNNGLGNSCGMERAKVLERANMVRCLRLVLTRLHQTRMPPDSCCLNKPSKTLPLTVQH